MLNKKKTAIPNVVTFYLFHYCHWGDLELLNWHLNIIFHHHILRGIYDKAKDVINSIGGDLKFLAIPVG